MRWRGKTSRSIPLGSYGSAFFTRWLRLDGDEVKVHYHLLGKSGSGKSRWLAKFYVNLIAAGYSATLIDPHGDLARLVLAHLVAEGYFEQEGAFERLLYLDIPTAAKQGRFLRFNCLKQPYDIYETTRLTLEALRRAFPTLAGGVAPAFEQIVTAGTHVLVANRLPLTQLREVLLNTDYRDLLLANVSDELIVSFFHDEYDRWDARERMILQGSTMRRLFLLLYSPTLRHALAAPDNLLEYRAILQRNQSLIVNLAVKDEDTQKLLGCLLTVYAEQGAKSRADLSAGSRFGTHFLALDEFHQFVSQSSEALTGMMSQTRKFGMFVLLSHQTLDQIPETMRGALQNVEVEITFRTGREDAERQARVVGAVDPRAVKHIVEEGEERSHPTFYSLGEQWEGWTQQVTGLRKRFAFVRRPSGKVIKVQAPPMPDPVVSPDRLAAVAERYLTACFAPAPAAVPVPIFDHGEGPFRARVRGRRPVTPVSDDLLG